MSSDSDSDSSESPNTPPSTAIPEKPTFSFTLPEWFLSDNVKTAKQLRESKPKIRLSRQKNPRDFGATVKQTSDHPRDKQDTFHESREIVAAYTEALAKEFDATLITLSIDDVQALALEFADQKPEDPNKVVKRGYYTSSLYSSLLPMAYYFASETSEKASKSLSGLAYNALFTAGDLADAASAAEQDGSIDSAAPATTVDRPLIIHVEETKLFEMDTCSERAIRGLKEFVIKERKKGRSIILVMTSPANISYSTLGLLEHSAFSLKSVHVSPALKRVNEARNGPSEFFMRKLKLCLRFHARQYLNPELLLPRIQWNLDLDENCEKFKDTNDALLVSLVSQITGRAHGEPQLILRDIVEVLHQVSASRKKEAKDQHEDTSEDETDEERGHASYSSETRGRKEDDTDCETEDCWDDSGDHGQCRDLSKYEKALVSSIVNTSK
ncbi:hypothetical protein NLG97_g10738 [Lecanicillium saksenae]|uniref:Uncharacterized protein n=1 Tax=Lecanicillium saksenae TaxID=468837 RepID=A0ACC1QE16_9HYPO|nr:hypothetical protein NLG97_g10738 [Lecanicillium saksenae]